MASIGQKLETKGVIMTLLSLVLISTGCEERIDSPAVNPSEGKTVEVTLNLGIADEEDGAGATASPTSKTSSNSGSALEAVPVYGMQTKSGTDIPDKLYNLEIWQYDGSGKQIGGKALGNVTVGSTFTASLKQATGCKLLLVARGASADFESLSGKTLSEVQNMTVKAKESNINAIAPNAIGNSLANMTYYLYLENVNITSAGKIESPAGQDVRLLLKRLATKVELNWTFASDMTQKGYTLKEVKLCQVPAHYRLIPRTEETKWGHVYPSSVAEFVVGNSEKKERLYYRVYLGGNETDDFNLLENTNYHWTVNINKADYVNDPRIQLLDQTPVKSTNEQPTSNCFMMFPGTNICFNPYKHEAGVNGWNTELTTDGSIKDGKEIKKVKILWQNKDAGTSGELVMGYPISESDHSNLVKLTNGDIAKDARIHLKVPVTNGGNALIAAYGTDDKIALWSWHIWVSDYVPALLGSFTAGDATSRTKAIEAAQNTTRGGIVHTYQGASWTQESGAFYKKVIMDCNLGAIRAVPALESDLESARTYGVLYQWGRKDPMPGSADGSYEEANTIFNADGYTIPLGKEDGGSLANSIANPSTFYRKMYLENGLWGPSTKTIYDPCPKGWKVPDFYNATNYTMFDGFAFGSNLALVNNKKWLTSPIAESAAVIKATNGLLYLYPGETYADYSCKSVWFPMYWMREAGTGLLRTSAACFVMYSAHESSKTTYVYYTEIKAHGAFLLTNDDKAVKAYGMSVRCIQEK